MSDNIILDKSIIIYVHMPFDLSNGGVTVQYYLASILDSYNIDVKICNVNDNNQSNSIFNKFITKDELIRSGKIENTIVIYCEGVIGNPLSAKYVVRWMLSKLGQNMPMNYYLSWNPNELIYFFNTETDLIDRNIEYKQLSLFYINPKFADLGQKREGVCFTKRKQIINNLQTLHPNDAFEITRNHIQDDYLTIFNRYEQFISYDPISFLTIIAAICGCISIVHPISYLSKKDYFKMTALYNYMVDKNIDSIFGIAYGNTEEEIQYAKSTLHLVKGQLLEIQQWFFEKYVKTFINDLQKWNTNTNTLLNYITSINLSTNFLQNFDLARFRNSNRGFIGLPDNSVYQMYISQSNKDENKAKNTVINQLPIVKNTNYELDLRFYRNHYKDLKHMTNYELIQHYNNFGKNEKRFASKKQFEESLNTI